MNKNEISGDQSQLELNEVLQIFPALLPPFSVISKKMNTAAVPKA